jgi:hypothetical protein
MNSKHHLKQDSVSGKTSNVRVRASYEEPPAEMEQGIWDSDIPDVVVHTVSENFLTVECGSQKLNLSKLAAMILVKQLSHALNRKIAKRSWFWKWCRKRLVARRDQMTERLAIVRQNIKHDTMSQYEKRYLMLEETRLNCQMAVVIRKIREMEME